MNIGQQILFLLGALGAFNGIILSLYLFLNRKRRSVATIMMGILLLAVSLRVVKSVFLYFNPALPKIFLQLGLSAGFLIGPALYYYTRAVLEKVTRIPDTWKWNWAIILGVLTLGGILVSYQVYPWAWNNVIAHIIYTQWAAYLIATWFLLRSSEPNRFLHVLFWGNCIIYLAYLFAFINIVRGIYISGPLSFTFVLYLTVIFNGKGVGFENTSRAERKKIAEDDARVWLEKLDKIVQEKKLYKDPNLKLSDLAQEINIPAHQLSQLLNENLRKSFSTCINEYRIREACRLIDANSMLTFEAIGYEVGYNSKSTFYAAFRKIKDTTPALYKESIENQPH